MLVPDIMESFEDMGAPRLELRPNERGMNALLAPYRTPPFSAAPVAESPLLNDPNTILGHYATSGTVSLPKVVRISHGNFIAEVNCAFDVLNLRPERNAAEHRAVHPHRHAGRVPGVQVPRVYRGVLHARAGRRRRARGRDREAAPAGRADQGAARGAEVLDLPRQGSPRGDEEQAVTQDALREPPGDQRNGTLQDISTIDKAKLTAARILLRNKLGGHFAYGISSSTKMDGALVRILGKLGITCIDIYGATECTGIIARNRLARHRSRQLRQAD